MRVQGRYDVFLESEHRMPCRIKAEVNDSTFAVPELFIVITQILMCCYAVELGNRATASVKLSFRRFQDPLAKPLAGQQTINHEAVDVCCSWIAVRPDKFVEIC